MDIDLAKRIFGKAVSFNSAASVRSKHGTCFKMSHTLSCCMRTALRFDEYCCEYFV